VKSKKEYLNRLSQFTSESCKDDGACTKLVKAEVDTLDDTVVSMIVKGKARIAPAKKRALVGKEVLAWHVQEKQQELEGIVKHMHQEGVISKIELAGKVKVIKASGKIIEDAMRAKKDSIVELEATLGITKEKVKDIKDTFIYSNAPSIKYKSPARTIKPTAPLAIEAYDTMKERE
jgi:hypothetical protein